MKKDICDSIEELINRKYPDRFYVSNFDYYLWIYKESTNNPIMIIHGHGSEDEPFESLPFVGMLTSRDWLTTKLVTFRVSDSYFFLLKKGE